MSDDSKPDPWEIGTKVLEDRLRKDPLARYATDNITNIIKQCEDFIYKLRVTHEYEISEKANVVFIEDPILSAPARILNFQHPETLADRLGDSITNFQIAGLDTKAERAKVLVSWINKAYSGGFIKEGSVMAKRIAELEANQKVLEKEIEGYKEQVKSGELFNKCSRCGYTSSTFSSPVEGV